MLVVSVLLAGHDPARAEARAPLHDRSKDYVGASTCKACHLDKFESWQRTYHRSMTQLPSSETVLGAFNGAEVSAFGASAVPFEREGRFFFRVPAGDGATREAEVALAVGSHRYQQYFERVQEDSSILYKRLPLLWHVAERRWLHLNGVFLEQDSDDWSSHAATWNVNCIFCHNTGVAPGVTRNAQNGPGQVDSHVADLGIACESCHGPGRAHAANNRSPLSRIREYSSARPPADIVGPTRLGQRESLAVCGQCHSQRLPDPPDKIWQFLNSGSSFRPGVGLAGHVKPLTRDTPVPDPSVPRAYSDRFWADGTARLTSYEYLGATQSPCMKDPKFTCESCHSMHAGDPAGQLRAEYRGDQACGQCHARILNDVGAHSHHQPASSGSRCLDCHMPRMVYGILDVHRSHRIESPDVRRDVELGRPNACTTCHLDKSPLWAAEAMQAFWGAQYTRPRARPDGVALQAPDALASLHAGDPVQRVVYAWHVGRADPAIFSAPARAALLANLMVGLVDPYGAMRWTARGSAQKLERSLNLGLSEALSAFDVQAEASQRNGAARGLLQKLRARAHGQWPDAPADLLVTPDFRLQRDVIGALIERQAARQIETGE